MTLLPVELAITPTSFSLGRPHRPRVPELDPRSFAPWLQHVHCACRLSPVETPFSRAPDVDVDVGGARDQGRGNTQLATGERTDVSSATPPRALGSPPQSSWSLRASRRMGGGGSKAAGTAASTVRRSLPRASPDAVAERVRRAPPSSRALLEGIERTSSEEDAVIQPRLDPEAAFFRPVRANDGAMAPVRQSQAGPGQRRNVDALRARE